MRIATAAAGGLALAAAVMAVLAFTTGGDGDGQQAPVAAGGARDGLAVWVQQGCGSCHALAAANANGQFGPDLGASLKGVPASAIRTSIVAPNASAAAGYSTGMMPLDYGAKIPAADLDKLVEFLRASAR